MPCVHGCVGECVRFRCRGRVRAQMAMEKPGRALFNASVLFK
jgi:hypothetical protein